jgi:hypothetical protein
MTNRALIIRHIFNFTISIIIFVYSKSGSSFFIIFIFITLMFRMLIILWDAPDIFDIFGLYELTAHPRMLTDVHVYI